MQANRTSSKRKTYKCMICGHIQRTNKKEPVCSVCYKREMQIVDATKKASTILKEVKNG